MVRNGFLEIAFSVYSTSCHITYVKYEPTFISYCRRRNVRNSSFIEP